MQLAHNLIPPFIHDQYQSGRFQGQFQAAALFLDISGFTPMTQALMQHGKEGAEAIAQIINRVFGPIIETIDEQGGFVTGFAGDAVTAVFPESQNTAVSAACRAALKIADLFIENKVQAVRLGNFHLAVKQGLSFGAVEWGIVGLPACKNYFFSGPAIDGCSKAEKQAQAGEIILDSAIQQRVGTEAAFVEPVNEQFGRLIPAAPLSPQKPAPRRPQAVDPQIALQFYPETVWRLSRQGEFRDVAVLFIAFQGHPEQLIQEVMTLVDRLDGFFVEIDFSARVGLFLVYFGAPITHENDIERSLQFISMLREALKESSVSWRVGMTFGTVYAGFVGSASRDKYTCMGDIVNLAARMMMKAEWGETLVNKAIALHPAYDFEALGALPYKGFAQAVPTYRFLRPTAATQTLHGKIVGREEELQRLGQFANSLFAERRAGAVLIYGEPGVGKSHLAYALQQAIKTPVRWMTGQSDSITRQAFHPFAYFLKEYFGQTADATEAQNKESFDHRLQDLLLTLAELPDGRPLYEELRRTHSFLGALLNLYWPDSLYAQLDAKGRYQNTLIAISTLLQAECKRQPVALTLEDGHWFDDASQEMLALLTRQARHSPLLLLITSRFADDGKAPEFPLDTDTPSLSLSLTPLSPAMLRHMAKEILETEIDQALYTLLWEKTQANPLFVQQILYYLQANQLLQSRMVDNQPVTTITAETFNLPTTLNTLLVARLDRLAQSVKEIVQTAAVLGREFEPRLLAWMYQQELSSQLNTGEREQIWTAYTELLYIFKHALLRDAAYEMQLKSRLKNVHYQAAAAAEQLYAQQLSAYWGVLAYHYETAYLLGEGEAKAKAQHFLEQAGQQAFDKYENKTAVNYFSRALALTAESEVDALYRLLLARSKASSLLGDRQSQLEDLTRLQALSDQLSPVEQAEIALQWAGYAETRSDYQQAIVHAQEAIRLGELSEATRLVAKGYREWGLALWRQDAYMADVYPVAIEKYKRALALAEEAGDSALMIQCLNGLGLVASEQADNALAQRYHEEALALSDSTNNLLGKGASLNNLGVVFYRRNEYAATKRAFEQSAAIAHHIGNRQSAGISLHNLGEIATGQGDFTAAKSYLMQSTAICHEVGDRRVEKESYLQLGHVASKQGEFDLAIAYFNKAMESCLALNLRESEGRIRHALGTIALAQSKLAEAENYYLQSLSIRQELNLPYHQLEDWTGLAMAKVAQGDKETAEQYARQIWAFWQEHRTLARAEKPIQAFHFAWEAMRAIGWMAEANQLLSAAAEKIKSHLEINNEPALQEMYLSQPSHKAVWAAWEEGQND